MGWIIDEAVWLTGPAFVIELEGGQSPECFETLGEVVCVDEAGHVRRSGIA